MNRQKRSMSTLGWLIGLGVLPALIVTALFWVRTPTVVVAVLGTGLDVQDPAVRGRVMVNMREKPETAEDDDENGLTNDVFGWNFLDGNSDLADADGLGTATAKELFAREEHSYVIPIKIAPDRKRVDSSTVARGIHYAIQRRAKIVEIPVEFEVSAEVEKAARAAANGGLILITRQKTDGLSLSVGDSLAEVTARLSSYLREKDAREFRKETLVSVRASARDWCSDCQIN